MENKKIDELIEALSKNIKSQTREEMQSAIKKAGNKKIFRRQIEMLAEYSRTCGVDRAPEASQAMIFLYGGLIKAECFLFVRILVAFFAFLYLFKRFPIKGIQFIMR